MPIKKLKKVYRIFFPKKFTSRELFEHELNLNNVLKSYTKENDLYVVELKNSLYVKLRDEKHSDYMVLKQVFSLKQYEILSSIIQLNMKANKIATIIDAGANVGYTSLFFLNSFNNGFVYAVEPSPENASMYIENIRLNKLEEKVKLYPMALSAKAGLKYSLNTKFRDALDWAITTNEDKSGTIEGITIGEIVSENKITNITLLKMDIEGAEQYIFDKSSDLSFLEITSTIAIEIHDEFNIRASINKTLIDYGYIIFDTGELTIGLNKNFM